MAELPKVVLVDDEKTTLQLAEKALAQYSVVTFQDPKKALQHCTAKDFDLLICDQKMPGMTGLDLIREVRKQKDDFLAIVISAFTDTDIMLKAVNSQQVFQYLVKPVEVPRLALLAKDALDSLTRIRHEKRVVQERVVENERLRSENTQLRLHTTNPLDALYGSHPLMVRLKEQIKSYAFSDHPILISGEEGTGKKLIARIIHDIGPRRDEKFVHFACSNYAVDMLEAELFGTAKAGGKAERAGFVAAADKGTLYIDDFTMLDKALQAKLLRLVNYGTYYSVGGDSEKSADVRLVLSTDINIMKDVQSGRVRKDLFYKIGNLHIKAPALRDRRSDIPGLIDFIVTKNKLNFPAFGGAVQEFFLKYLYPGNVRELEGLVEKVAVSLRNTKSASISEADLEVIFRENVEMYRATQGEDAIIRTVQLPTGVEQFSMKKFVETIEKELIQSALNINSLNISQTARTLMISRQGLKNKIKRYGLEGYDDSDEEDGEEFDDSTDDEE